MSRWIRALLCCVIALAVPLQAFAHERMRSCDGRDAPQAAQADAGDHAMSGADRPAVAHALHGAIESSAADIEIAAEAPPSASLADAGCVLCAACTIATGLPTADVWRLPAMVPSHTWAAGPAARIARSAPPGLERPPRAHTA